MATDTTVLVVEDEILVAMDLEMTLEENGFRVLKAPNADKALELLEAHNEIQLIITDIDMPGSMDGLRLAAAVSDRWPPTRIILVSGHRMVGVADIPDGSLFFSKPYRHADILSSMRELLR